MSTIKVGETWEHLGTSLLDAKPGVVFKIEEVNGGSIMIQGPTSKHRVQKKTIWAHFRKVSEAPDLFKDKVRVSPADLHVGAVLQAVRDIDSHSIKAEDTIVITKVRNIIYCCNTRTDVICCFKRDAIFESFAFLPPPPHETLRKNLKFVSDAFESIKKSGVSERMIILMLHDLSGVSKGSVKAVLDAGKELKKHIYEVDHENT